MPRKTEIQVRRDTAANWTSTNPVLALGEPGWESDTDKLKFGDGVTAWASLAYFAGSGSGVTDITSAGSIAVTAPTGPTTNVDVASSGVSAATYGDSTHVGQFHVGADGRITAAAAIAISGIAGAGFTTLFDQTLGSNTASIDTGASGIAQTSQHLLILLYLRYTGAATNATAAFTLNGDTGAHYDRNSQTVTGGAGSTSAAAGETSVGIVIPGSTVAQGTLFGVALLIIPAYTQTAGEKMVLHYSAFSDSTTANSIFQIRPTNWRSTAAVNQATIAVASNALLTGSRMTVYGMG